MGIILFGNIGFNAYRWNSMFNNQTFLSNIGIAPYWDIFSGGAKLARYRINKYEYKKAAEGYQQTMLNSIQELNNALACAKATKANLLKSEEDFDIETQKHTLATRQFNIGDASKLDEMKSHLNLLVAKQRHASSKIDDAISSLSLYNAVGGVDYTTINSNNETQSAEIYADSETGIEAVKNNTLDVFYVIPDDFAQNPSVQIYAKPSSSNIFTSYQAPILTLLTNTAVATTAPENIAILTNTVAVESINFSAETDEVIDTNAIISRMIIPGVGLALFYILIIVLGNRLTTAMVEEKENRISEMILTSMRPQDLITGKIISLIILGLIQLTILILPVIILYSLGIAKDLIPFEFNIDWNPWLIISTIALLLSSYFLFTALCVTVSTLVPTAKDAGSFASIIVILVILPFFFVGDFTSNNPSALAYILSYFPPSAPLALMFRNTFGTLPAWEAILGFIVICVSGFLLVKLAVYIFKRTAIEFTARVNLRALLQKPRKNWKRN